MTFYLYFSGVWSNDVEIKHNAQHGRYQYCVRWIVYAIVMMLP